MTTSAAPREAAADMRGFFNDYVLTVFPERKAAAGADWAWPGDEWADEALREATFALIGGHAGAWREVVEFGPGAGKYTGMILARSQARVVAYEISDAFIDVLRSRFPEEVAAGRLDPRRISWTDNEGLLRDYGDRAGTADLAIAIDMLLMMDFQSALVYLLSAARMLREGGLFFATFGDGGSQSGWDRMIRDAGRHSAFDASPSTRFHWIDAAFLRDALARLGFSDIAIAHGPEQGLDVARLYVSARLTDPQIGRALAGALAPAGDSTNRRAPGDPT